MPLPATAESPSRPAPQIPLEPAKISLPKDIGKLEDLFSGSNGQTVILIRDAHSVPNAQRNIEHLIDYFQKEFGVDLVALEGAPAQLDPRFFRAFPDREVLREIFDQYSENGELMGGTAAAVFNEYPAEYHGLEDWALYEQGLLFFIDAQSKEAEIAPRLQALDQALADQKQKIYSPRLLRTDRLVQDFYENRKNVLELLSELSAIQPPPAGTELDLLYRESVRDADELKQFEWEVKRLSGQMLDLLKQRAGAKPVKEKLLVFNSLLQEFRTSRLSAAAFALWMQEARAELALPLEIPEKIQAGIAVQKSMQQIQGSKFFAELERYAGAVKASLMTKDEEKTLEAETRRLRLLKSFLQLEIDQHAWEELRQGKPLPRENELLGLGSPLLRSHTAFYRNAEQRDEVFFENIRRLLARDKKKTCLAVTGGFHTEELKERFKSQGFSFLVIVPEIKALPQENLYRKHMRGSFSWSDYFEVEDGKVEPYKAFVRKTRDLLLKKAVAGGRREGAVLKLWRDEIIRQAADAGEIKKVSGYTRWIDELLKRRPSAGRPEAALPEAWQANVERFINGLRRLERNRELTSQNILDLIKQGTIPTTEGVAAVPGVAADARVLPFLTDATADSGTTAPAAALGEEIKTIGFFPGLDSIDAYVNAGSELYDTGIPAVRKIYEDAAYVLGYVTLKGEPIPSKLFFISENYPADPVERQAFLGAAFLVHNLALDALFRSKSAAFRLNTKMDAYAGESFGILAAAVATGAMTLKDGLLFVRQFGPVLAATAQERTQVRMLEIHLECENLKIVLEDLSKRYPEDVEVQNFFSGGPGEIGTLLITADKWDEISKRITARFPVTKTVSVREAGFIAHSKKNTAARNRLDDFLNEADIQFSDPRLPIISNNNRGVLKTATEVAQAILDIVDKPMFSEATIRETAGRNPDFIVELGRGGKTRELVDRNYIATPFVEFGDPLEGNSVFFTVSAMNNVADEINRLKQLGKDASEELSRNSLDTLRAAFIEAAEYPFAQHYLFNLISQTVQEELFTPARNRAPPFYRFLEILQNSYLVHVVMGDQNLSSDLLILSAIFKQRLMDGMKGTEKKIDLELEVMNRRNEVSSMSMRDYKYPEVVTFAFNRLPASFEKIASETKKLLETQPRAWEIYEWVRETLGLESMDYFTDTSKAPDEERLATVLMVYQYAMFELTRVHRPAVFGQNCIHVTGSDDLGRLTALAASGAMKLPDAIRFYRAIQNGDRETMESIPVGEAQIRFVDIASGVQLKKQNEMAAFIKRIAREEVPMTSFDKINLPFASWILSYDSTKTTLPAQKQEGYEILHLAGIDDLWRSNVNPTFDILDVLSILRMTDQNGVVFQFAEGRGTTTSNVYAYLNAGERVVGFGRGGAESLVIFLRQPGESKITVRKVMSERLITMKWERGVKKGTMKNPLDKAEGQARFIQGLPEDTKPFFPTIYRIDRRDVPIPPDSAAYAKYEGKYMELQYDMSYLEGEEVSNFIKKFKPPPEIVAKIYEAIFTALKEHIHSFRQREPQRPTLEVSYFDKIEKRLEITHKRAPNTFREELTEPDTITIDGASYLNVRPLLREFRGHPEYLAVLEPPFHSMVIGDTNTENIMIGNIKPILDAMNRGDTNFSIEEIGIKFFDPRAIGYQENGEDTGSDDPMYDNKPWHNSIARYDAIHGEHFDVSVTYDSSGSSVTRTFHDDDPYAESYTGMESLFKQVMTNAWDLDNPDSEYLRRDPYWLIRFAFIMGTHFTAMPPFQFKTDTDGNMIDDARHQRRPVGVYTEGIKWLNWALEMLRGERKEFLGFTVPPLPHLQGAPARSAGSLGAEQMSAESRLVASPGLRLVRTTALGQYPIDFDPAIGTGIRGALDDLRAKVSPANGYNNFADLLTRLILDLNQGAPVDDLAARTDAIFGAIRALEKPYLRVTASAVLAESFAKLGLDSSLLVNADRNLIAEALDASRRIPAEDGKGEYERVTALASLFMAAAQSGLAAELTLREDAVAEALDLLEKIPDAYYQGRAAAMLFSSIGAAGFADRIDRGAKNYIEIVLDSMDRKLDRAGEPRKQKPMKLAYPLFTLMNSLAFLNKTEYLGYKRDWLENARWIMNELRGDPQNFAGMSQYYLLALYNLGELERFVPDLKAFLRENLERAETAPYENAMAANNNLSYQLETAWLFGYPEFITERVIRREIDTLGKFEEANRGYQNTAFGSSYVLTVLGELGRADLVFRPDERFGGKSPLAWIINDFSPGAAEEGKISLPYLNNALLSLALRMRGKDSPPTPPFQNAAFARETGSDRTAESRQLIAETLNAAGLSSEIRADRVQIVPPGSGTRQAFIDRLNGAIDRWMNERNARVTAAGPLSPEELARLIDALVRDHREAIDGLAAEFEDPAQYPGNASIGLGGKLGQPTIFINGWMKGRPSRMHDHGASKAAYHVYRGTLTERILQRKPGGKFTAQEKIIRQGETAAAAPPYVHQLENANADASRTITINAYSPLLVLMNRYDFKQGKWVFAGQWLDDEVVHEVKTSRPSDGSLSVALEQSALDDWRADEGTYPGYLRNALALTLLYSALEGRGVPKAELIKKGYTIENLNEFYAVKKLDGDVILRIIQKAAKQALEALAAGRKISRFKDFSSAASLGYTREALMEYLRENKLLVGMHVEEIQGMDAPAIVEMGRLYESKGIVPEIGASREGIEAIRKYRAENPKAIIAAGEIEENNVEQAVAAVEAGANVLVAMENPISAAVVQAARKANPEVVIIAAAITEESAEASIANGVDGIKLRPFALDAAKIPENTALLKKLRQRHPGLLIGASRGIKPEQLEAFFEDGMQFVGLGVKTAIAGAEARERLKARGPLNLTKEARVFINQWNRISRGVGVGMFPAAYDAGMAENLRRTAELLSEKVPATNAYHRFTNLLTRLTLDSVNPEARIPDTEIRSRTREIVSALHEIQGSLLFVNAAALLFETYGKLGLNSSLLVNPSEDLDLVKEALDRVERISPDENTASGQAKAATRGNYDQLISYSQLFTAIGHLGLKERLLEPGGKKGNYIESALAVTEEVPSPFARGRYASQLFSSLKVLGYEKFIFENSEGRDFLRELLDYLDEEKNLEIDRNLTTTPGYRKAYSLLLTLISIGVLEKTDYLTYNGKDRMEEAREVLGILGIEDDVAKQVTLFLLALQNAGQLGRIEDREAFLKSFFPKIFSTVDKNTGYAIELLLATGRKDLMPEGLLRDWIKTLDISKVENLTRIQPYTAAFMLTILGQLGHDQARLLFEPDPAFGGEAPFLKFASDFAARPEAVAAFLPMIDHALLNYALRMRGEDRDTGLFDGLRFADANSLGMEDLSRESRAFISPWIRNVRATGLGQYASDFDPRNASHLREALAALREKMPSSDAYHRFTQEITELILRVNDPSARPSPEEITRRTGEIAAAIAQIKDPYRAVTATAILLDAFAKLGLDRGLLVNPERDLLRDALLKLGEIPAEAGEKGVYERLTASGNLFLAAGQLGLADRLTGPRNFVKEALDSLSKVPSVFYRGRGGSVLFTALGILGLEDQIFAERDYLKELLDYFDENLDRFPALGQMKKRASFNTYPLLTVLNSIALLKKKEYLNYRRDWLEEAKVLFSALPAKQQVSQGQYYLMALYNLGELDRFFPDLEGTVKQFIANYLADAKKKNTAMDYHDAYAVELASAFGFPGLITPEMLGRVIGDPERFERARGSGTFGFAFGYALTTLGNLGLAGALFEPNPAFGGEAPLLWSIKNSPAEGENQGVDFNSLYHSIIGSALRMRGAARKDTALTEKISFLREEKPAARPRPAAALPLDQFSNEARTFFSLWIQMARGKVTGGPYPVAFDPELAKNLRTAAGVLASNVPEANAYNRFSVGLTELILDAEDPAKALPAAELRQRIDALVTILNEEKNPYEYATAAAILMETIARLGLDPSLAVNARYDLAREILNKVDAIPVKPDGGGYYEKVSAFSSAFLALGQLGLTDRILAGGRDRAAETLSLLEKIPAPWNRGRAASILIASLKIVGLEDRLTADGRNYVEETFDAVDRSDESYSGLSKPFFKIFPLLTLLNSVALLNAPEYLTYKTDRLRQAADLLARLSPVESVLMTQYYLMALYNLGELESAVPNLDAFLERYAALAASLDPSGNWFPNGVALPYAALTLGFFGRRDLAVPLIEKGLSALPANFAEARFAVNRDNPAAYFLSALSDLGEPGLLLEPIGPAGESSFQTLITGLARDPQALQKGVPALGHALINAALRLRGTKRGETPLYRTALFLGDDVKASSLGDGNRTTPTEEDIMRRFTEEERIEAVRQAVNERFKTTMGAVIDPIIPLGGGFHAYNRPFKVRTEKGTFIVKRESVTREKTEVIVTAQTTARRKGLDYVVEMVADDNGSYVHEIHGQFYSVQKFVTAEKEVTDVTANEKNWIEAIGAVAEMNAALKDVHVGTETVRPPHDPRSYQHRETYRQFYETLRDKRAAGREITPAEQLYLDLYPKVVEQLGILEQTLSPEIYDALPTQLINTDMRFLNMFFTRDDKIQHLFDFGFAGYTARIRSFIGPFFYNSRLPFDYDRLVRGIAYYNQVAEDPLTDEEIMAIPEIFRGTWLMKVRYFFWESKQFGLENLNRDPALLTYVITKLVKNWGRIPELFPDANARKRFLSDVKNYGTAAQSKDTRLSRAAETAVVALAPVGAALGTQRPEDLARVPPAVIEMGINDFSGRMIDRLRGKIAGIEQNSGRYADPRAVKGVLGEIVRALSGIRDRKYDVAYALRDDNRNFADALREVSALIERLILVGEGRVESDLLGAIQKLGLKYSVERSLDRLHRSIERTVDQKAVGLVKTADIVINLEKDTVLVPVSGSLPEGTEDPLLDAVVIAMQTAVALLLAHEAVDEKRKREILENPAALLLKYNLFPGFENQVLVADGKGGLTVIGQALQEYVLAYEREKLISIAA